MVTGGMKNRVTQAAVCGLVLFGMAAGAGFTAPEIPAEAGWPTVQETFGVLSGTTAREVMEEIVRPLGIASQIVSISEGYGAIAQMLSPLGYGTTMEKFFRDLNWHLERYGDGSMDVVEAVCGLLDNQGELYFENYREEEIRNCKKITCTFYCGDTLGDMV